MHKTLHGFTDGKRKKWTSVSKLSYDPSLIQRLWKRSDKSSHHLEKPSNVECFHDHTEITCPNRNTVTISKASLSVFFSAPPGSHGYSSLTFFQFDLFRISSDVVSKCPFCAILPRIFKNEIPGIFTKVWIQVTVVGFFHSGFGGQG